MTAERDTFPSEIQGEIPPNLESIPVDLLISTAQTPRGLWKNALEFIKSKPEILEEIKKKKKDVLALVQSPTGQKIIIGAGGLAVIASAIGAIVVYEHGRKKRQTKEKE